VPVREVLAVWVQVPEPAQALVLVQVQVQEALPPGRQVPLRLELRRELGWPRV
jgi:hypothetical protein